MNKKKCITIFKLIVSSILIGLVVGAIDTVFGRVLIKITNFRQENYMFLIPFLSIGGLIIIYVYDKYGKNTESGMNMVFETVQGKNDKIPLRLVPLITISTWITHLFGGSAGREGVAVQIGATISDFFSEKLKIKECKKTLILVGMAAGFAGLFQTPIASVFFALEVVFIGVIKYDALILAIISAFTSSYTSSMLGLEKFSFNLSSEISVNAPFIIKLILISFAFALVGKLFALSLKKLKSFFNKKIENKYKKIFFMSLILSALLIIIIKGRYGGLGTNLIELSFNRGDIYYFDWILKLIFTVFTLAIGFQGGEVTPLFAIGSSLGAVLALILGIPIEFCAALGYIGVFSAATNTFIAPIFIGAEVFGFTYMPYYFIVCAIAYIFSGADSIYGKQIINKKS